MPWHCICCIRVYVCVEKVAIKQLRGRKASVGNLTGLWLGNENKERDVLTLSIWVKKRESGIK